MITASEYLRANTNKEQCENMNINNTNRATCLTTNWMYGIVPSGGYLWTISSLLDIENNTITAVINVSSTGYMASNCLVFYDNHSVSPALYLSSNITLTGDGSEGNPYIITN